MHLKERIAEKLDQIYMHGRIPISIYEKEVLDYCKRDIRPATESDINDIIKYMSWSRVKELVYHN